MARSGQQGAIEAPVRSRFGYRDIAKRLIGEIHAGDWPVGAKLPTEAVLVDRFGVSRNTVREALRELRDIGYLSKRRGTPSVVISAVTEKGFVNSIGSISELLEYAGGAHNTLLSSEQVVLLREQALRLDCAPDTEWVRMQVLRRRDPIGLPFCYSELFVHPRFAGVTLEADERRALYRAIEQQFDVVIARVVQEIEAAAASSHVALRLEVPEGSPIMLARNHFYSDEGELVEIGMAHFAPGRYRLRIALDRRRAD
jgi:DNA-binding GntR family transcriptional regulator